MQKQAPGPDEITGKRRHLATAKWVNGRFYYGNDAAAIRRGQRKQRAQ